MTETVTLTLNKLETARPKERETLEFLRPLKNASAGDLVGMAVTFSVARLLKADFHFSTPEFWQLCPDGALRPSKITNLPSPLLEKAAVAAMSFIEANTLGWYLSKTDAFLDWDDEDRAACLLLPHGAIIFPNVPWIKAGPATSDADTSTKERGLPSIQRSAFNSHVQVFIDPHIPDNHTRLAAEDNLRAVASDVLTYGVTARLFPRLPDKDASLVSVRFTKD